MKEVDRAWLAAMIDGEGCITISHFQKTQQSGYLDRNRTCTSEAFVLSLSISNNNRKIIDRVEEITNTKTKIAIVVRRGVGTSYRWKVSSNSDIIRILDIVEPYLIAINPTR